MTGVLIVDDERNIRKAFRSDIEANSDKYTLVEEISSAADAVMVSKIKPIDLVLMDINTANGENGIEATKALKETNPNIRVIVTTSYADPRMPEKAKEAGADSFWFKDYSTIDLIEVMDITMRGEHYWPEEVPDVKIGNISVSGLTPSEKEIIFALAECVSIKKMSERLFVEESTIKTHLKNICNKTGCANKTELLVLALQSKMVLPHREE